jgi:glycosyltransferase involved in cell wall biosynthesis
VNRLAGRHDATAARVGSGRIAILAATSGHSGVDRVVRNLSAQLDAWGIGVDLLQIRGHGPTVDLGPLTGARTVDLGSRHVNGALPRLVRWLRRERPAALLTDKDRVNRIAVLARIMARVETRLVVRLGTTVSVNLADRGWLERTLQRASIRHLYPRADAVIVPSRGAADDLLDWAGLDPALVRVVRSPIVTPRLARLAAAPMAHPWLTGTAAPPVVLGVGELGFRKDFETLVRAFAVARRQRPCRLIILGRGRRHAPLRALADSLGVGADVDLPGFNPNPYAFMARAAVFVLSSRWEGMPVALVEALAAGTPAVATDCPSGPAEVLAGGRCGTLVPIGDVAAMAAGIVDWIDHRPDPAALAAAVAPYRIEQSARDYLTALGLSPGQVD